MTTKTTKAPKIDMQNPMEAAQGLMAVQADAISKSIALQKKSGEQLVAFFQGEAEKAKSLKTPQELVQFNVDCNTALFGLMKTQGEELTALATEVSNAAVAQLQNVGK